LRPYEAIIIFNSELAEDKVDLSIAKFEKKIKDNGGTEIVIKKWGMKKLASRMTKAKKANEGNYVLIEFNGEGKTPNELKSLLNVSEEVIRYTVACVRQNTMAPKEEKVEIEPSMLAESGESSTSA
jgi:small subunit ribosomal protein S6